jgi:ketosteroid isomerase-like protein
VSADGSHGFTFGYTTLTQPDGATVPGKYVAYWTRAPDGWRVSAYKRVPRPAGDVAMTELPPALPTAPARRLSAEDHAHAEASLRASEIAFSDHAGAKGLGAAFRYFGAADAVNVGGPQDTSFVRGPDAISASVAQGSNDAHVSWAPDIVRVAGSGDLGVSLGYITVRLPAAESSQQPRRVAYLTIWRRDGASMPWRYVAE